MKGSVVVVSWKPCTASLFTIYYREVLSERKSHWSAVNVSGHETSYDLYLNCDREYEIAVTAWNSAAETPLNASNHSRLWRVKTLGGNNSHSQLKTIMYRTTNLQMKYLSFEVIINYCFNTFSLLCLSWYHVFDYFQGLFIMRIPAFCLFTVQ